MGKIFDSEAYWHIFKTEGNKNGDHFFFGGE